MITSVRSKASRCRMPRPLRGMALGALLALSVATPALARGWQATASPFAPFPVISHHEMAQLRGGFNVAGLELQFGANIRTLIDDVVRLETIVHFTKAGLVSTHPNLSPLTAGIANAGNVQLTDVAQQTAQLAKNLAKDAANNARSAVSRTRHTDTATPEVAEVNLTGTLTGLHELASRIKAGGNPASANRMAAHEAHVRPASTAAGPTISHFGSGATPVDLSGLGEHIRGVVLNDTKGLTAAIQGITHDHIVSTVINQANNRRIQVHMNLQIDIKNFSQYSEALRSSLLNQRLAQPSPPL